jgi:glyoxylate reductase
MPARVARCFVTRRLPGPALDRLQAQHEVEIWPDRTPPSHDELVQHSSNAEGLLSLLTDRLDADTIAQLPELRVISNYAVGYDNVDLEAASERGIRVGNTPGVLTDATADLTFALLLAAARRLPEALRAASDGEWLGWEPASFLGAEVHGATLGIIGFGRIGQAVAKRAEGFDMRVLHIDSHHTDEERNRLLKESDFVSVHCPLTPKTHHLINAEALKRMKPTAILINTARGEIVDQAALETALNEGQIAGAALDVTEPEPPERDDPLLAVPNLVLTPHIGSATRAARELMADLAVDNLLAGLAGKPMPHEVFRRPGESEATRETEAPREAKP